MYLFIVSLMSLKWIDLGRGRDDGGEGRDDSEEEKEVDGKLKSGCCE